MKKSFRFYYLGLILFIIVLAVPLFASTPGDSFRFNSTDSERFFTESSNQGVEVYQSGYSANFYISNNCGADLFVGNRTDAEWLSFKNNHPDCISISYKNCGDFICNSLLENYSNCNSDCLPVCGDGVCLGESCLTCSTDCGSCCGNGVCDNRVSKECYNSSTACPGNPNYYCSINISGGLPTGTYSHCSTNCTVGYCESSIFCPEDCPACGDGFCNYCTGENYGTCPADCQGYCGDGYCGGTETCNSCSDDCGLCCGNCLCDYGENRITCKQDCTPPGYCGDGDCSCPLCNPNCGVCPECENGLNCPTDCGICGDGVCNGIETKSSCYTDCGYPIACPICPIGESCPPCEAIK